MSYKISISEQKDFIKGFSDRFVCTLVEIWYEKEYIVNRGKQFLLYGSCFEEFQYMALEKFMFIPYREVERIIIKSCKHSKKVLNKELSQVIQFYKWLDKITFQIRTSSSFPSIPFNTISKLINLYQWRRFIRDIFTIQEQTAAWRDSLVARILITNRIKMNSLMKISSSCLKRDVLLYPVGKSKLCLDLDRDFIRELKSYIKRIKPLSDSSLIFLIDNESYDDFYINIKKRFFSVQETIVHRYSKKFMPSHLYHLGEFLRYKDNIEPDGFLLRFSIH